MSLLPFSNTVIAHINKKMEAFSQEYAEVQAKRKQEEAVSSSTTRHRSKFATFDPNLLQQCQCPGAVLYRKQAKQDEARRRQSSTTTTTTKQQPPVTQ